LSPGATASGTIVLELGSQPKKVELTLQTPLPAGLSAGSAKTVTVPAMKKGKIKRVQFSVNVSSKAAADAPLAVVVSVKQKGGKQMGHALGDAAPSYGVLVKVRRGSP
jgi:hypothetical protein